MTDLSCDTIRVALLDPRDRPRGWMARPDVEAHLRACPACRDFVEAFSQGERAFVEAPAVSFADAVLARTAGLEALLRDLPSLADMEPGPGFAERVLLATSRRPHAPGWRTRLAAAWWALVRRPRFAWEAAYVATLCWVLLFGNPVGALEWSATNIRTVAEDRLSGPAREIRSDLDAWRSQFAADPGAIPGGASSGAAAPHPAVRAWQAGAAGAEQVVRALQDALDSAADLVGEWLGWLSDRLGPPPTEPEATPARSGQ